LELFVEPQKVAVAPQDGRKDLGGGHVGVVRGSDIDAVRGILVDSF
jgi:hypothetical protein